MWLAVCSEKHCRWEHTSAHRRFVEAHWQWHVLETDHHGALVDIPLMDPERLADRARLHPKLAA